jgi:hypothetical protein
MQSNNDTLKRLLREANKLHKTVKTGSLSQSLPILRRLITSKTLTQLSLPELRNKPDIVQRKHLLQMLAHEAGYSSWASYKHALETADSEHDEHYSLALQHAGYPNLWFSSLNEAEEYVKHHGGKPVAVGRQAVVIVSG